MEVKVLFRFFYLMIFIVLFGILLYSIAFYKKRNIYDYIIIGILLIAFLIMNIISLKYFYLATTGHHYYSLYYEFGGFLSLQRYDITTPPNYELRHTKYFFDITLPISFVCFLTTITLFLIEKRKNKNDFNIS